jgi:hypothetical protein
LAVTFGQYVEAIQGEVGEPLRASHPPEPVETALGDAIVQSWDVGKSTVSFKLWVIPVCNNSGAIVVAAAAGDSETRGQHEQWLGGLRRLPGTNKGLCAVLDP